jgi:hypothetical protein
MNEILIEYGAVANADADLGYVPRIWVDGRGQGPPYSPHHATRDEAMAAALIAANDEASRYLGDYSPVVSRNETAE